MNKFDRFLVGKNRTQYKPTDKHPEGYIGVMVYEWEFQAIQLNAYCQGMLDAAEVVVKTYNTRLHHHTIVACKESILTTANNLTKLPG